MTTTRYRSLSRLVYRSARQRGTHSISRLHPPWRNFSPSTTTTRTRTTPVSSSVRWHSSAETPQGESNQESAVDRSRYTTVVEVRMPDMGSTGEYKVLKWHKAEGDLVRTDDVLCDIETPDFVFGMECEDDDLQIMGQILVEAPSGPIPVNQVICTLLHETKETKAATTAEAAEQPKQDNAS